MAMSKTQAKEIARDTLSESIGIAYYKIADNDTDYSEEEKELIIKYINQLGKRACKTIDKEYVSY
ncbi:hypothetical protein D7V86_26240 [bacterium D16-51]|nr:hypothetical protein D7V96_26620 [bacterium D16-59]RKI51883.1 hypothetical protein D7V86_26240 [bacterium D16-51]